eukprot:1157876-Pelagomonas_calceolata.AAC.2
MLPCSLAIAVRLSAVLCAAAASAEEGRLVGLGWLPTGNREANAEGGPVRVCVACLCVCACPQNPVCDQSRACTPRLAHDPGVMHSVMQMTLQRKCDA